MNSNQQHIVKSPPSASKNIFSDINLFLLNKPKEKTLIKVDDETKRTNYTQSILQRIDYNVDKYKVFNIHRIGVEAPSSYVFNELMNWSGESSCWPNHIAKVSRVDNKIEKIKIFLFGKDKYPFGINVFHLFNLNAIKIQKTPISTDFDNARYLLYECSGGYPIGIFAMYVRSSISERGEKEMSQVFFVVGFNFYGKNWGKKKSPFNILWEKIHNRVTENVLNRFKQLSEWRFDKIQSGIK